MGLVPAIDAAARLKASHPEQVFESHPEVVFSALAGGVLPAGKKTLVGSLARISLLSKHLGYDVLEWVLERECSSKVAAEDWIDSLAMVVVAADWGAGRRKLLAADGTVAAWTGEVDGLIALPWTDLAKPPPRLSIADVSRLAAEVRAR